MKSLRSTWLYLLVAVLPFERIPSFELSLGGHAVTLRLSLIVAVVALAALGWRIRVKLRPSAPEFWLLAYLAVIVLSVTVASNYARSLTAIIASGLTIGVALLIAQLGHRFDRMRLFYILSAVSIATCLFGLFQYFGDSAGLSTSVTGLKDMYTKSVFGFPRVQSTGLEPLYYANFLLIPILLTVALFITRTIKSYWWLVALYLYILTLALTLSRGGSAGCAIAGVVLLIVLCRRLQLKRTLAALAIAGAAMLSNLALLPVSSEISDTPTNNVQNYVAQSTHFTSEAGSPDNDRVTNRRLAIAAFKEHPVLGVGIGNFGTYAKANEMNYRETDGGVIVNNEYLEVLAETGLLGALALSGFLITLFVAYVRSWSPAADMASHAWRSGLAAVIVGFLVQYYAFSTLYIMHIWVVFGLLLSLTARRTDTEHVVEA